MANSKPTATGKRRVRNPETFRERAIKAANDNDTKAAKRHRLHILGTIFRPIGRGLQRLFSVQPFKTIGWLAKRIAKFIFPKYLRNSAKELRLVTWPNWRLSRRLTYAVLVFAIIFGASVATVDYGLDKLFKVILLK